MTGRLFGTDGVRGAAGELLTAELALALGRAAVHQAGVSRPRVLIIRDTRESGDMLQAAFAAGVASAGGEALLGGVLPTPAAPLLVVRDGLALAAVLSASHNPYPDNGVKLFGADGYKISDEAELEIEAELAGKGRLAPAPGDRPRHFGQVRRLRGTAEHYLAALTERFDHLRLDGLDVLLDCANGATFKVAPEIFGRLGARVTAIAVQPDGRNINEGCGSTHVSRLAELVVRGGHDLGFAFDGDGDRVLAVDREGAIVDGDELMALGALHLRQAGRLPGDGVVVTVMTNYGFHAAMAQARIDVATTPVGDRSVLAELRTRGWALGGEQSGHIIQADFNPSGDGIAGALLALEALGGRDLHERDAMHKLPQQLVNVRVRDRGALARSGEVREAIDREHLALRGRGRVLVRASGTEPLVRVMVEAPTEEETRTVCERLVALVRSELGEPVG